MADNIYLASEEHFLYNCEHTDICDVTNGHVNGDHLEWVYNPLYEPPWCDQVFIQAESSALCFLNGAHVKSTLNTSSERNSVMTDGTVTLHFRPNV